jgi:hypothetical protein
LPLGLPCTLSRSPLRRLPPFARLALRIYEIVSTLAGADD